MATQKPAELTVAAAVAWLIGYGEAIEAQKAGITELDSAIGDADHAINMDRGFSAVRQKLAEGSPPDLGALFKLVGSTLISTVGGASGPLYGTAFLRLGSVLVGKQTASLAELAPAFAAAYEGVAARGKSARGEKTMLDALGPAVDAFRMAQQSDASLTDAAAAAAREAEAGARATVSMLATKGRGSFLGEKSLGHPDPGAVTTALLFKQLAAILVQPRDT